MFTLGYTSFRPSPRKNTLESRSMSIAQNTARMFVSRVKYMSMFEPHPPIRNAGTPFVKPYAPGLQRTLSL